MSLVTGARNAMNVIIAGDDSLGILMGSMFSEDGHQVSIVELEGRHLRSLPKSLRDRKNISFLEANPLIDETMLRLGIRRCDVYIAAMRSVPANGLAALKAKMTYQVEKVAAVVTDDALAKIYPRFGVIPINPHRLSLSSLNDALHAVEGEAVDHDD